MPYIGKSPLHGNYSKLDSISSSFDGSTTQFALTTNSTAVTPVTASAVIISINGVLQEPVTAYTVSGTNITFTSAPASTDTFFGVVMGEQLAIGTPSDSTITSAKLSGNLTAPGTFQASTITATTAVVPDASDGATLGSASLEWSDLYIADGGVIYFGDDQDVTVTHDPDDGLFLKSTATSDDNPVLLTLQTGETDIAADDVIGKIAFQAPDEGTGTDAILVAAAIQARSEGEFSSSSNATSIDFMTGSSEAAAKKWTIKSDGKFEAAGAYTIDMNAGELILDADADTSITADTDDQIDIKISGADDFQFTANTFTVLSGSTLTVASGATIANSGTATGFGGGATTAKTSAYTVASGDDAKTILCSAASADYAITLLAASSAGDGFEVTIKKTDATKFMITVEGNSSETIDGLLNVKLRHEHASVTIVCDGSNWHIKDHSNLVYEYNSVMNPAAQIDQFSHQTRTGVGDANEHLVDRWQIGTVGSASARWTFSIENSGGTDGKSEYFQLNNTTADASPGSAEGQFIKQTILGDDAVNAGFLGTDSNFENGVLSMDMNFEKGGGSSLSAPYIVSLCLRTLDGTQREIFGNVSIAADNTWQRVYFVIPEDGTADIDPSQGNSHYIGFGLYGGSGVVASGAPPVWQNAADVADDAANNLADATGNKIKWTAVKFQPGQIPTPFHPLSHAEEMARCQFYAFKFDAVGGAASLSAIAQAYTANNVQWTYSVPEMRRANHTLTVSSGGAFKAYTSDFSASNAFTATSDPVGGYQTCTQRVQGNGSSGLTAGNAVLVVSTATGSYIFIDKSI